MKKSFETEEEKDAYNALEDEERFTLLDAARIRWEVEDAAEEAAKVAEEAALKAEADEPK